ncbi:MAG: cupin domain-containing protein [Acidobacteria bacterium]|nr:MAG: cupin domain-containing protein [Acidobacteriota bacterium]
MPPASPLWQSSYATNYTRSIAMARRVLTSRWDEMSLERITEMVSRKVIAGARQRLAQVWLKRGALVARHAHDGEQITYVLDGALRYSVDGEDVMVRAGDVLVIPPGAKHQITVLEDALVINALSGPSRPSEL